MLFSCATTRPTIFRPRLMLVGSEGQGQTTHLAPAIIHQMENLPCHVLDLPTLYAVTAKTPEESCANVFHEAKRKCPSILYLPYMDQWWDVMADTLRATLLTLIHDLDPALPLLLLATSERPYHMLDPMLRSLFSMYSCEVNIMRNPNKEERHGFFKDLLLSQAFKAPPQKKQAEVMLNLLTKHPNDIQKKRNKPKLSKSKGHKCLPNFIYPFGKFESSESQPGNKGIEVDRVHTLNKKCTRRGVNIPMKNASDSLAKLDNLKLKLYNPPCVNPCHRMVLRSRAHLINHLNSNQSARIWQPPITCAVYKSSCPALRSDRFTRLRSTRACSKTWHKKVFKRSVPCHQRNFKKPNNAPCQVTKCIKMPSLQTKLSTSKAWNYPNQELSSRHERYTRRLQRLEARMCELTNRHPSDWADKHRSDFCALSARHLRYLRRLRRVESALHKAHAGGEHLQRHCPPSTSAQSSLSCGSFQMLYKKKDKLDKFERNFSLPLNLKALAAPQIGKRHQKTHKRATLKSVQRKKCGKNSASFMAKLHCNLSKKRRNHCAQHMLESLPLAAPPKPRDLSPEELALLEEKEELTLMELRIFLRDVLNKLGTDKKFSIFAKPVNIEDAADYYDIIEHPMDLSSMMAKIDLHEYSTVRDFLNDVDLICSNALEYNPDRGPMDRVIRHRACALKDTAYAIIKTELDKEFEKTCAEIQESRKRRGQKSSTVPNFYNTRLKHGNSSRPQTSAAATASYLDKPQLTRTIPKPDGERFSRRVRGLDTDPVPPLESVEKVFKSSRSAASPTRENMSSGNSKENRDDDSVLSKKEQDEEDKGHSDTEAIKTSKEASDTSKTLENSIAEETKDAKTNNTASSVNSSKKKRSACVWCRPKRKRRRLGLPKSAGKTDGNEKDDAGDSNEEDGDLSMEDEEEVENEIQLSNLGVDQQLAIDTSECAGKMTGAKNFVPKGKSTCSPASVPLGVNTRRSSMSPRLATMTPHQASKTANNVKDEKSKTETSVKETDNTYPHPEGVDSIASKNTKGLLLKSSAEGSSSTPSQGHASSSVGSETTAELGARDKPSVVKRLDLDMVITDSGHGSSLESNGDSRDSTDHKDGLRVQGSSPISKALPAIEALVNSNANCSSDLRTTAAAILTAPKQTVVTDVPRMTHLLNRLVVRSDGFTVERLEKIYSQLSQLIYKHRQNYNKIPLTEAMEGKVEDLTTQTIPGTSKH
ncbi:ATPase family AAA domain-containing protein 2 [Elysia marginata]|uniref:ATPase family AAA domain-containing protein 2 n=1 Tax=Elysia marginata TaxID=1093978 RepID=A0AAV4HNR1_9GAST|nr:ATPase family AAA domain-containing protein 2 [Elysia marginata]